MSERSWELGPATSEGLERAKEGTLLPCAGIPNPEGLAHQVIIHFPKRRRGNSFLQAPKAAQVSVPIPEGPLTLRSKCPEGLTIIALTLTRRLIWQQQLKKIFF